ncbi:18661_t:CDS:2 [Gigaspora rosea]|nr:18661_t:CDS:2 [Gigaspora rosea]
MEQINNQRLKCLLKPARWDTRAQCRNTLGEPDNMEVIDFGLQERSHTKNIINNNELLHSIIDIKLLAVAEVKLEQLMTNLIKGTKLYKGKVKITDEREELFDLYNSAVDMVDYGTNDYTKYEKIIKVVQQAFGYMVTWFLKRDQDNANIVYISPMVPINQQHTETDHGNSQDLDSSNSDQSGHDSSDDYKLKSKCKKVNNSDHSEFGSFVYGPAPRNVEKLDEINAKEWIKNECVLVDGEGKAGRSRRSGNDIRKGEVEKTEEAGETEEADEAEVIGEVEEAGRSSRCREWKKGKE